MPSECRMPSIFGPTPEISLRSSTAAGFSMPAGRFGSSSDGFLTVGGLLAGGADRLAAQQFRRSEAQPVRSWPCATCAAFATPSTAGSALLAAAASKAGGLALAAFSPSALVFSGDGVFSVPLVSAASVCGLAAFEGGTVRAVGVGWLGRSLRRARASLSRVDFRMRRSRPSATSGPIAAPTRCVRSAARPARRVPCRSRTGR